MFELRVFVQRVVDMAQHTWLYLSDVPAAMIAAMKHASLRAEDGFHAVGRVVVHLVFWLAIVYMSWITLFIFARILTHAWVFFKRVRRCRRAERQPLLRRHHVTYRSFPGPPPHRAASSQSSRVSNLMPSEETRRVVVGHHHHHHHSLHSHPPRRSHGHVVQEPRRSHHRHNHHHHYQPARTETTFQQDHRITAWLFSLSNMSDDEDVHAVAVCPGRIHRTYGTLPTLPPPPYRSMRQARPPPPPYQSQTPPPPYS